MSVHSDFVKENRKSSDFTQLPDLKLGLPGTHFKIRARMFGAFSACDNVSFPVSVTFKPFGGGGGSTIRKHNPELCFALISSCTMTLNSLQDPSPSSECIFFFSMANELARIFKSKCVLVKTF